MDAARITRMAQVRAAFTRLEQQLLYESATITRLGARITVLESEKATLVKAIGLIDQCVQIVASNGIGKIESIVSDGLRRVFADPSLNLVVEKKAGARGNSYRLLVKQGSGESYDPMNSFGGGLVNVVALLLRLIIIKRFRLNKFLVLDEQFSNVSSEYLPAVSLLLQVLTERYGYTIFAITHQPVLAVNADHIYRLHSRNGQPTLSRVDKDEVYAGGLETLLQEQNEKMAVSN